MKVLVANRGEVAARIVRTLKVMGVKSLAIFAPEDEAAPHVYLADEAIALDAASDHLDGAKLVALGRAHGATHVHPGYGFLSQSPGFVTECLAAGLVFVGPSAAAMARLGDKSSSRLLAQSLQIPVVPGAHTVDSAESIRRLAQTLGYPLLLKAAGGGGGRGMRQIKDQDALADAFLAARREAEGISGDPRLLVERFIAPARHIEMQVIADGREARVIGDRECSLQRRYQKVIEEAPASVLDARLRQALTQDAEALVRAAEYQGICTVEFLLGPQGAYFFLEVNPRLQVEHPVTEMCNHMDLVAIQMALAEKTPVEDLEVLPARGHAIEARLMAEDPARNFMPQTGEILLHSFPTGPFVRVDAGIDAGSRVTPMFDSLLAKIIAWGPCRQMARQRLVDALGETVVLGVNHNLAFLRDTLLSEAVVQGQTFTDTLTQHPWRPTEPDPHLTAWIRQQAQKKAQPPAPSGASAPRPSPWSTKEGVGLTPLLGHTKP